VVDVGAGRQVGFVLPLAVGDDVVDRREPHVVGAGNQVRELVCRAGCEVDLDIDLLRGEEPLALRHPNREVKAPGKVDYADHLRRVGMLFGKLFRPGRLLRASGHCGSDQDSGQDGHAPELRHSRPPENRHSPKYGYRPTLASARW
jgi:hypothetical protein